MSKNCSKDAYNYVAVFQCYCIGNVLSDRLIDCEWVFFVELCPQVPRLAGCGSPGRQEGGG